MTRSGAEHAGAELAGHREGRLLELVGGAKGVAQGHAEEAAGEAVDGHHGLQNLRSFNGTYCRDVTPGSDGTDTAPAEAVPCPVKPDRHPDFVRLGDRFRAGARLRRHRPPGAGPQVVAGPLPGPPPRGHVARAGVRRRRGPGHRRSPPRHPRGLRRQHGPVISERFGAGVLDLVRACTTGRDRRAARASRLAGPQGGVHRPPRRAGTRPPGAARLLRRQTPQRPGHPGRPAPGRA